MVVEGWGKRANEQKQEVNPVMNSTLAPSEVYDLRIDENKRFEFIEKMMKQNLPSKNQK